MATSASDKTITLAEARERARAVRVLFGGVFRTWTTAGGVRRAARDVRELQHVVVPAYATQDGLFGKGRPVNLVRARAAELIGRGSIAFADYAEAGAWRPLNRDTDRMLGLVVGGVRHELHFADPDNYGVVLLTQTGPDTFVRTIRRRLRERRYEIADGRLWRIGVLAVGGSTEAPVATDAAGGPVAAPNEQTIIELAGMSFVAPELRR